MSTWKDATTPVTSVTVPTAHAIQSAALNARIQAAKAVAKRSTRRLFFLTMLTIPSTLGRDQKGVNGVMGGGVPSQDRSPWVFLWPGRYAGSGAIPRGNARSIRDLNALP